MPSTRPLRRTSVTVPGALVERYRRSKERNQTHELMTRSEFDETVRLERIAANQLADEVLKLYEAAETEERTEDR